MGVTALVAIAALAWGAGSGLLGLARCRHESAAIRAALALTLGLALLVLGLELALLATGRVLFAPVVAALAPLALAGFVRALRRPRALPRLTRADAPLALVALLVVAALGAASATPFVGYDEKAIYGLKAKALLAERTLEGPLFQDPEVVHYHVDYPLGVPLLVALAGWIEEGATEDPSGSVAAPDPRAWVERYDAIEAYAPVACLWLVALALFAVGAAWSAARGAAGRAFTLLLCIPAIALYPWEGGGSWSPAGPDLPLAACFGVALVALRGHAADGGRGWLALAALAAAAAPALKTDALLGLGALLVALALHRSAGRWRCAGAVAAGGALGVLAWLALRARCGGAPYEEDYVAALFATSPLEAASRVPLVLAAAARTLERQQLLAYFAVALAVAVPVGWIRGGTARVAATWLATFVAAATAVFLVTPNHAGWHVSTALPRIWCQLVVPAAFLLAEGAAYLWSAPSGSLVPSPPRYPSACNSSRFSGVSGSASPRGPCAATSRDHARSERS